MEGIAIPSHVESRVELFFDIKVTLPLSLNKLNATDQLCLLKVVGDIVNRTVNHVKMIQSLSRAELVLKRRC